MIEFKIAKKTPDSICEQCAQCYEGDCLAFSMPQSSEEEKARRTGYGMECDLPANKERSHDRYGVKYHTPPGRFE